TSASASDSAGSIRSSGRTACLVVQRRAERSQRAIQAERETFVRAPERRAGFADIETVEVAKEDHSKVRIGDGLEGPPKHVAVDRRREASRGGFCPDGLRDRSAVAAIEVAGAD